ncbi:tripartite motif-containing protein 66-like [Melanaphis sacchari]|uniref:tripartite motif-containing protein 66-like n=1 Tax=Melanaphis sacchari TaxID=742174 RepID=UPI000DC14B81|nr:tripartite motif-containing protein 66-like [Melanaphis sacchari]XP_025191822.1 tripartite motif-containing protein 66-like [Melanaphis sacchari]XP_025191823.1 tripartite motif-containing protein 66-like [Melanaphis sacchari]
MSISFYLDIEDSDEHDDFGEQCSICLDVVHGRELMQCQSCDRKYHNHCHLPKIPDIVFNNPYWSCTMCKFRELVDALRLMKSTTLGVSIGEPGRIVAERLIMTLSNEYGSIHFREFPSNKTFPTFFEKVSNPINLIIIINRLESNTHYTTIDQVIDDLKKLFTDSLMFYDEPHEFYGYARHLLNLLDKIIAKWIPELEELKTKTSESSS